MWMILVSQPGTEPALLTPEFEVQSLKHWPPVKSLVQTILEKGETHKIMIK